MIIIELVANYTKILVKSLSCNYSYIAIVFGISSIILNKGSISVLFHILIKISTQKCCSCHYLKTIIYIYIYIIYINITNFQPSRLYLNCKMSIYSYLTLHLINECIFMYVFSNVRTK